MTDALAGYRRTEVRVRPPSWTIHPIGRMGNVLAGKALAKNGPGCQRPYLRTKNILDGRVDLTDVLSMPMTDAEFARYRLRHGDVLLNEGQSLELVGRCSMYRDEHREPCAIQNQLIRFRANEDISAAFAAHLFRHCQRSGVFSRVALQTTSVAHLGVTRFKQLHLAWPRKPEQDDIARILTDVDELIDALAALVSKKRAVKQAVMHRLLSGDTRLPGFRGKWATKRLGDVVAIRAQKVLPSNVAPNTLCVELDHIAQDDGRLTTWSTAQQSTSLKYRFFRGDVLFGRLRSYLRKFWHANRSGICTTEIWPLVADSRQMSEGFLYAIVQSQPFIEMAGISYGTHMPRTDWKVVQNFEINLPHVREQQAIVAVFSDIDRELASLDQLRGKVSAIMLGMVQQLLTGRIRLGGPDLVAAQ